LEDNFDFELIGSEGQQPEVPPEQAPQQETKPAKKKLTPAQQFFKDARDVIVIVTTFMLVYVLFFRAVVVVGDSMYDTLMDGDYLLVLNNLVYKDPKQGDIIVASKDSFRGGECIIKRVIATEGQEVDIDFETGKVYVDGELLDEPYLYTETTNFEGVQFPLTVDEGCLFVMGDNRRWSMDSRDPLIGLIDEREVLGRAIFLLMPGKDHEEKRDFSRIGGLD
jgi:signal peptidase I